MSHYMDSFYVSMDSEPLGGIKIHFASGSDDCRRQKKQLKNHYENNYPHLKQNEFHFKHMLSPLPNFRSLY